MRRSRRLISILFLIPVLFLSAVTPAPAEKPTRAERKAQKEAIEKLPDKYRQWLRTVDLLITDEELASFLALEKDYQRDAFIDHFWEVRDTYKSTARNEFRARWEANVQVALTAFGSLEDDRARVLLLNGPPADRVVSNCSSIIWPAEVWFYVGSDRMRSSEFK